MAITPAARKRAEKLIYAFYDAVDKTKTNSEYYKKVFAQLSDKEFEALFKKQFPLKFHVRTWDIEPTMTDIKEGLDLLGCPMTERVREPFRRKNKEGKAVLSQNCDVLYIHIKKEQQFITKKNSMSTNIDMRDMTSGLLLNFDKNGKTSDKEHEAMITMGLDATVKEFNTFRADSMNAKNVAYSTIASNGILYQRDLPDDPEDSLATNLVNVYLIGAGLMSNLLTDNYILPHTALNRKREIKRG